MRPWMGSVHLAARETQPNSGPLSGRAPGAQGFRGNPLPSMWKALWCRSCHVMTSMENPKRPYPLTKEYLTILPTSLPTSRA